MKSLLLVAAGLILSTQAHAGAFSFSCSNARGTISIDRFTAKIDDGQTAGAIPVVEYKSKSLGMGANEIEKPESAVSIEIIGKRTTLLLKDQTDECNNTGEKLVYSAKVAVKSLKTRKLLIQDFVVCEYSFYPGHCF